MRRTLQPLCTNQRGIVLVMVLILMGLLAALASGYAMMVRTDTVLRGGASRARQGFYTAEGGLNAGMAEFADIFRNYGVPQGDDFEEQNVWVGNRLAYYDLDEVSGYAPCTEEQPDCFTTIPAGEKFAGLNSIPYRYTVKSASLNSEGDTEAELGAEFDIHNIPIFQFLAFYANDLEILPGPNMNLSGRIHTNGELYLNANNTMTIGDRPSPPNPAPGNPFVQVSAGGQIHRGRKNNSDCTGTVEIDKLEDADPADGDLDELDLPCSGGSNPVPQATIDSFLGSVLQGVEPIQIPSVDQIQRGGEGRFWQNADLRIVLRLDQPPQTIDFGVAGLCPGGPAPLVSPALFPIEVQDAAGNQDVTRTTALQRLMCERRGAIFYNDVPTNAVDGTPNEFVGDSPNEYTPPFQGGVDGSAVGNEQDGTEGNNYRVYRRVGEDTNGDGFIDNTDFNPDICPDNVFNGNPVWEPPYCAGLVQGTGSWFDDTDYRRGGYYNHREDKWMYLLNVNIRALIEWNAANGGPFFPPNDNTNWGVVIFLSVQGPNSDGINNYGTRVFDSADLDTAGTTFPDFDPDNGDPTGLTVVTDQALYVQGNYNSYSTQTRGQKDPAALIGDSINVLSQTWETPRLDSGEWRANDRKSGSDLWAHRRVLTQDAPCGAGCGPNLFYGINAAFISGVDDTIGSSYNGGLENYPRFHEKWSSRTLVYRGSYVSLGNPLHANGAWSYGSPVYQAPGRDWDYDADFNRVEALPPLTPLITYVQQRMYTRFYD